MPSSRRDLASPPSVVTSIGTISRSKRPSVGGARRAAVRLRPRTRRAPRGVMPHFSAISSAEMPWGTRPPGSARASSGRTGSTPGGDRRAHRHARHALDAGRDHDVVRAGDHALGGEVHRLLGRPALAVDRRARHRLGEPGGEHGVAADVDALVADLHDATHDHVVDQRGIEVVALDERAQRVARRGRPGASP